MAESKHLLQQVVTEVLVLDQTDNFPRMLDGIVDRAHRFRDWLPRDEFLRAVDFLESRKLLQMRTPRNNNSKTLFVKKTEQVPNDALELIHKLMHLHGIPVKVK